MSNSVTMPAEPTEATDGFEYWWSVQGEWVEPPNERRNGWSGMMRVRHQGRLVYVKRQRNHLCRTLRHPLGWPTACRERLYLGRLNELGLLAPIPIFHATERNRNGIESVLVTEELTEFQPLCAQTELPAEHRRRLACRIGHVLGTLHRARLQHSCLYDKHIMVRWHGDEPAVALIDLEKMRSRLTVGMAARHDLSQLKRRQAILNADEWALLERTHAEAMVGENPDSQHP